jgi:hypothetical protein
MNGKTTEITFLKQLFPSIPSDVTVLSATIVDDSYLVVREQPGEAEDRWVLYRFTEESEWERTTRVPLIEEDDAPDVTEAVNSIRSALSDGGRLSDELYHTMTGLSGRIDDIRRAGHALSYVASRLWLAERRRRRLAA